MTHPVFKTLHLVLLISLLPGLTACGGGSNGWVNIPPSATAEPAPAAMPAGPTDPAPPSEPSAPPPDATPPLVTHTVGGQVTGLAEHNEMVLLNNGGDALTLTSNGPFRFSSAVPAHAAYAVTLNGQPLWQACTVSNGSGTAATDVIDVEVNCSDSPAGVSTWAGTTAQGLKDGQGAAASFSQPTGVAVDRRGNVYVADYGNHVIRKITPDGMVSRLAGSGTMGAADGLGAAASFQHPTGVAVDAQDNVYVADSENHTIRKITPSGEVTTFAGSTTPGSADGAGTSASFNNPYGVAVDAEANVYVADLDNHRIRKITPFGEVTTLAGSQRGSADGTGAAASFYRPAGIAVDASGQLYVSDYGNNTIRRITPKGVVTTLAGSRVRMTVDGKGTAASFIDPAGLAVDASGTVFVAEYLGNVIRKITPAGDVTIFAGTSARGAADGIGPAAGFREPHGVAVDANGELYIADSGNNMIRKITPVR